MRLEVHRGSPEQRAAPEQVHRLGQFAYFDRQLDHPDWTGKTVLEFGGDGGDLSEPIPEPGMDFDVILADSIFTHATAEDRSDLVRQLLAFLAPGGALAFTFEDPQTVPFLARLYPNATIRPPADDDEPYCCILRRRA